MPFLFDGYNVYHAGRKLSEQLSHIPPFTFCSIVAEDIRCLGERAVVVFDGRKPPGQWTRLGSAGVVEVVFSGSDSDADTVLEELIRKNSAPRRLMVVSSDNRVRRAARRRRCGILKAAEYIEAMLNRLERPPPRPREPSEKQQGLSGENLNDWLELFDIDPDKTTDDTDRIGFG